MAMSSRQILDLIRSNTNAKYDLHVPDREAQVESFLEDCGARGFTLPQGFVSGATADLYKKELQLFSDMLSSTTITPSLISSSGVSIRLACMTVAGILPSRFSKLLLRIC